MQSRADARLQAPITLFFSGDVMTARGIDQALPTPSSPMLHESYVRSALGYVELAERANGPIPRPVDFGYIWGDALAIMDQRRPDLRIINLETSITTSDEWEDKGINYRMHPGNLPCLSAAKIDCCVLANNHVLDWGVRGLEETLESLRAARIATAGAGATLPEALAPATLETSQSGRVLVFAFGISTSGIPAHWEARSKRPGVSRLARLDDAAIDTIASQVRAAKRRGDVAVASVHWGPNWGYSIARPEREFAHRLVDEAAIDIVHGHSSHHPKGIEVYGGRLLLYGCGDFINDYEGIGGREEYRGDLSLAYFPRVDASSGRLLGLDMEAFQMRRFQLHRASRADLRWLRKTLDRECRALGASMELEDEVLRLRWTAS